MLDNAGEEHIQTVLLCETNSNVQAPKIMKKTKLLSKVNTGYTAVAKLQIVQYLYHLFTLGNEMKSERVQQREDVEKT